MPYQLKNYHSYCQKQARIIVCTDSGTKSRYTAMNRKQHQVRQYRIDGEIIVDTNINKCDWLITEEDLRHAYLIELKGKNIQQAIVQLESTEHLLSASLQKYENIYYRISPTSVPHHLYNQAYKRFKQKHPRKDEFICKENLTENIN